MTAILVDGHNMMHRAYHAVPYLSNKDGIPTNAIMGMVNMVLQDISTYNPKYMVVAFDRGGSDWRKKIYPEYKANRESKTDTTLKVQMQGTRRLLRAMGIRVCGLKGVEADDIIATLALKLSTRDEVLIKSRDKDFCQLVGGPIRILDPFTNTILDERAVLKKFGVKPSQIVEFLAMKGDGVDNIKGIENVADKKASALLRQYKTIKGVLHHLDDLTPKLRDSVKASKPILKRNVQLITLDTSVDLGLKVKDCELKQPDFDKIETICKELGMSKTLTQINSTLRRNTTWSVK